MDTPRTQPWKRANPKKKSPASRTKLTPQSIAAAKAAAKKAGRRYPNLVDNMNAARKQRAAEEKRAGKVKGTRKSASARSRP